MPKEGVEPSPCCQDGILNPARLPVPPLRPRFYLHVLSLASLLCTHDKNATTAGRIKYSLPAVKGKSSLVNWQIRLSGEQEIRL